MLDDAQPDVPPLHADDERASPPPLAFLPADLPEACRTTLEQLHALFAPDPPPAPTRARDTSPPPASPHAEADAAAAFRLDAERGIATEGHLDMVGRPKLPRSLLLRKEEYKSMMAHHPRWLGSGSLGAVYDVDLGGTRVAVT